MMEKLVNGPLASNLAVQVDLKPCLGLTRLFSNLISGILPKLGMRLAPQPLIPASQPVQIRH